MKFEKKDTVYVTVILGLGVIALNTTAELYKEKSLNSVLDIINLLNEIIPELDSKEEVKEGLAHRKLLQKWAEIIELENKYKFFVKNYRKNDEFYKKATKELNDCLRYIDRCIEKIDGKKEEEKEVNNNNQNTNTQPQQKTRTVVVQQKKKKRKKH